MATPAAPTGGGVSPPIALAFATVGFGTLAIAGIGVVSLLTDADVIAVPGLGAIPGVVGMLAAVGAFAGAVWVGIRRAEPRWGIAPVAAVAAVLAHAAGILLGAAFSGVDVAAAVAAAGGYLVSPFSLVVAAAGLLSAFGAIALVRTSGGRPRWPWEDEFDE